MSNILTQHTIASHQRARFFKPSASTMVIVTGWLVGFFGLVMLNSWLWNVHGVVSGELLWWEAQRRLVSSIALPNLAILIQTNGPLVLYLTLLTGSATNVVAVVGATALAMLAWKIRAVDAPPIWLPLLVFQPALVVAAAQSPSMLLRAILLGVALIFLWRYLADHATYQLMSASLALGAWVLVEAHPLPVLVSLMVALLLAERRKRNEHATMLLVCFFPSAFLFLAWRYLNWVQQDSWFTQSQLNTAIATIYDAGSGSIATEQAAPLFSRLAVLLIFLAPASIGFAFSALQQRQQAKRLNGVWVGSTLLLAIPLLDAMMLVWRGEASPTLAAVLPLFALPLIILPALRRPFAKILVGIALVGSMVMGWTLVMHQQANLASIANQAPRALGENPVEPFHAIADTLNQRLEPGQRVMLDNHTLAPLVALVKEPKSLLLPHETMYALATQNPDQWADFVVVTAEGPLFDQVSPETAQRLSNYEVVQQAGAMIVYQRKTTP